MKIFAKYPSMFLLGLTLLGLSNTSAGETEPTAPPPIAEVDAIFANYDNPHSPGCALGVIRDGEFIYRSGYGMANLELDTPISSQSIFRIASTSKQFTAMAIALLAETGRLSLDDPLSKYFLAFPPWAKEVTIAQLVHHTSGVRDYLTLAYLAGQGADQDYFTTDWVMKLLGRQRETNFPPGSQYLYSNSGYLLLGQIVERVSEMSLKEFSQAQIFGPLEMNHSHFHDDHTHIVPQRASGYAPTDDGHRISMTTLDIVGDGGVYTSIDDLLLWDRNFYQNQLGTRGQELIEEVTTTAVLSGGEAINYAFGLSKDEYRGQTMISHGGAFVGFRAEMIRFPEQNFSVAVLCNHSDAPATSLAQKVADHFLAEMLEPLPENASEGESTKLDAEELQRYAGDFWEASEAFAAETRFEDGKLWAVHSPERRNELVPLGRDRFKMIGLPYEVIIEYEMSEQEITRVNRFINGKPRGTFTPFERKQARPAELAEYRADYYSPELDIEYWVRVSGSKLLLQVEDEPSQDLTPMFDDTFENPDFGAFQFVRSPEGKITGFTLQSGRVRNLMFYRKS